MVFLWKDQSLAQIKFYYVGEARKPVRQKITELKNFDQAIIWKYLSKYITNSPFDKRLGEFCLGAFYLKKCFISENSKFLKIFK